MGNGNVINLFKYKIFGMDFWDHGICNGLPARRHIFKHNVQFVLWKAGQHGHKTDFWIDFDSSWWSEFKPNPKYVIGSNGIINGDYKEDI